MGSGLGCGAELFTLTPALSLDGRGGQISRSPVSERGRLFAGITRTRGSLAVRVTGDHKDRPYDGNWGDYLVGCAGEVRLLPVGTALEFASLSAIEALGTWCWDVAGLFALVDGGQVVACGGARLLGGGVIVECGNAPSLCLSPGGGEMGMSSVFFPGGGEMGMGSVLLPGGGEIMGRIETCPFGCGVRLGEAGELFQVLEVLEDRFQKFLVVLGCGGGVRVTVVAAGIVVPRGATATGGAILFGHVGSEEHHQEGRRGVGLLGALEEHDFEHVGVPEDGYFEPLAESEDIVGLPLAGSADGHARIIGGEADDTGIRELFEIDGLKYPSFAVFGREVVESDSKVAFEFGGLVVGADAECLEGGQGFWVIGAGCWEERRKYYVGGMIVHVFLWCQVGGFTKKSAKSTEGRSWDFTLTPAPVSEYGAGSLPRTGEGVAELRGGYMGTVIVDRNL